MNKPTRRTFLKLIGAGVACTVIPLPTIAAPVNIDKLREGLVLAWRPGAEKERSFSPGNPAVYARDVLTHLNSLPSMDMSSWVGWASYCEEEGLTMLGHVCDGAYDPPMWEHLQDAAEAGHCMMAWNGSRLCFWPACQAKRYFDTNPNPIDFDDIEADWNASANTVNASKQSKGETL